MKSRDAFLRALAAAGLGTQAPGLQPDERAFDELLAAVSAGKLRCEIAGVFPLEDAARAIELSQTGHVAGKIVIRVA